VDPRTGLDTVAKRKVPLPCWDSIRGLVRNIFTILTELYEREVKVEARSSEMLVPTATLHDLTTQKN